MEFPIRLFCTKTFFFGYNGLSQPKRRLFFMQVIVMESPKPLAFFLKLMFKIK